MGAIKIVDLKRNFDRRVALSDVLPFTGQWPVRVFEAESYMRGLMHVIEPLAREKGVANDQFVEPPGKRSFVVSFWVDEADAHSTTLTNAQRDHEAFMANLVSSKRANLEFLDSQAAPGSAGTLIVDATSRAEVTSIVMEDPAVRRTMIEFEVVGN